MINQEHPKFIEFIKKVNIEYNEFINQLKQSSTNNWIYSLKVIENETHILIYFAFDIDTIKVTRTYHETFKKYTAIIDPYKLRYSIDKNTGDVFENYYDRIKNRGNLND